MKDFITKIGYLEQLKRRREAAQALKVASPKPPTLHDRAEAWQSGLSCDEKSRAWKMAELRAIFNESPQKIGAALFELGWSRKRLWRDDRPTARYWFKK